MRGLVAAGRGREAGLALRHVAVERLSRGGRVVAECVERKLRGNAGDAWVMLGRCLHSIEAGAWPVLPESQLPPCWGQRCGWRHARRHGCNSSPGNATAAGAARAGGRGTWNALQGARLQSSAAAGCWGLALELGQTWLDTVTPRTARPKHDKPDEPVWGSQGPCIGPRDSPERRSSSRPRRPASLD